MRPHSESRSTKVSKRLFPESNHDDNPKIENIKRRRQLKNYMTEESRFIGRLVLSVCN